MPSLTPRQKGFRAALEGLSIETCTDPKGSKGWSQFRAGHRDGQDSKPRKKRVMTYTPESRARMVENGKKMAEHTWGKTPAERRRKALELRLKRPPAKPRADGKVWISALVHPEVKVAIALSAAQANLPQPEYLADLLTKIHRKEAA